MKRAFVTLIVALFATVVFGQTKTAIKPMELPKCVAEWIKMNMKGFDIDKAYRLETKSDNKTVTSYYARAAKAKEIQWLLIEQNCSAVKKITEAQVNTDPPRQLPPVKTKTATEKVVQPKK